MKVRVRKSFRFRQEMDKRAETSGFGLIFAHTTRTVTPPSNALFSRASAVLPFHSGPVFFRRQGLFVIRAAEAGRSHH
jgi:hypothetical protein